MKLRAIVVFLAALTVGGGACKKDAEKAAPPTPAPAAEGIKLPMPAPKVGDKRVETEDMAMDMMIEDGGKQHSVKTQRSKVEDHEVLAVDGDRITKVKITYKAIADDQTVDGKARSAPSAIVGKTYVVEVGADKLTVTTEAGAAPPANELAEVTKRADKLLRQNRLEKILSAKTFQIGQKIDLSADELVQVNTGETDATMLAASFALKAADAGSATFTTVMAFEEKLPKGALHVDLTSDAVIDRKTGEPLSVLGSGPVSGFATGTMTAKKTYTYAP